MDYTPTNIRFLLKPGASDWFGSEDMSDMAMYCMLHAFRTAWRLLGWTFQAIVRITDSKLIPQKGRFCLHVLEEIPFPTTVWMYKTLFLKRNIFTYQRVSQNSEPSTARTSNYGAKNALNMCISLVSPPRYTWRSFHPMPKWRFRTKHPWPAGPRGPCCWGYVVSFPRSIPKDLDEAAIGEARSMLVTRSSNEKKKKPLVGWVQKGDDILPSYIGISS